MVNFSRQSHNAFVKWLWTVDKVILFTAVALLSIGIILDFTASPAVARRIGADDFALVRKQIKFVVLSVAVILGLSLLNLKAVRRLSIVAFVFLLVLLILTPFFGHQIKGARRWIYILGISLQASELMKPVFIVLTAWLLDCAKKYDYFPGTVIAIGLYGLLVGLLLCQPDIGMTLLVTGVFGLQLFLSGMPWKIVIAGGAGGLASLVAFYFSFSHFRARVDQFLYGSNEATSQINVAMRAFQNGNLLGRGPGEGTVKLTLPDAHTDFVFAVAGEEYGVWLCLVIIALFAAIVIRTLKFSIRESNLFVMYAEVGLAVSLGLQAFVNMASSLHIIPTKGMTLPFISYGGSSLLGAAIEIGMLLAITRKNTAAEDKDL